VAEWLLPTLPAFLEDLEETFSFEGGKGGMVSVVSPVGLVVAGLVAGLAELAFAPWLLFNGELAGATAVLQPEDVPALQ
jgi:hypothetical protein